jgi:ergothioneine biosynthesis protein EgtB
VTEEYLIQSMPDASPTKWHLAHTSWFFETFILARHFPDYRPLNRRYAYLFNSYYTSVGARHNRPERGLLSRPTVDEVYQYRAHVNRHMQELFDRLDRETLAAVAPAIELGIHHEQQHQELILTDIKDALALNPSCYRERTGDGSQKAATPPMEWHDYPSGIYEIGHRGEGFAYDNDTPRHRVFATDFRLGSRLVTCGEYLAFMEDGGYHRPELWLSEGWDAVQQQGWHAPLYWSQRNHHWQIVTLNGVRDVDEAEPLCHVSYFESDAYARWASARLPTEAEWEIAAAAAPVTGNFVENDRLHPMAAEAGGSVPAQLYGDVWEWTQSPYSPYPGYQPLPGQLGEYNGKFMCNQFVLRGGSCATSITHIRPTYRNFFPAHARWQFSGIRLAQ